MFTKQVLSQKVTNLPTTSTDLGYIVTKKTASMWNSQTQLNGIGFSTHITFHDYNTL
jgi:hypothetical protein